MYLFIHLFIGIFVVTGLRKNALRKTEFRLSSVQCIDSWSKLKRGDKSGSYFVPLRKVLNFV